MKSEGEINPLLMTFTTHLTLSQAQECILEKSMTDNRKPNIIAKVAMQVVEYLRLTLKNLESFKKSLSNAVSLVGSKLLKTWQRHCDFKVAYYLAVTMFHQGLQSEEQQKMGERIAFYQGAVEKLDEALKLSKNMEKAKVIGETLTFANDVIRGKLTAAQKENEFVYHEKVPPLTSLHEVKGASLVKGISFSFTDKEVAGNDIFSRLVPMEAHQASSLYSEEKAKLLRRVTGEIQEKNEELEMYLASMQLDSFAFEENFDDLPQEVVDSCADLNSRDAFQVLKAIMDKINCYYHDLQAKIKETEELIKNEEGREKEFCIVIGAKRAPNQILIEQKRELAKYKEAHDAALTSNQALHSAITHHKENILLLSKPLNSLIESLPSVAGVESEADRATRLEVQRLLNKVHDMQQQRIDFENKLRINIQEDDVTKQLVTNQDDVEEFFKEQISKHKHLVVLLDQNMSAQINILQALSEANAAYGAMRRTINQVKGQRSDIISSLLSSYNAFLNIIEKAEEAKEFYSKLETQVNKLNSRVKSFCKVQEEEREERLTANIKKFGGNIKVESYGDSKSTGPKLKDFLQAGMKGMQTDNLAMDISSNQRDYGQRSGINRGNVMPSQMVSGYRTQPARPTPVGSERSDHITPCNMSQHSYPLPSQYPPSAPSPAPTYPNPGSYYPTSGSYYQPNQISGATSTAASFSTTTSTTASNTLQYQNYNQASNSSTAGYNYAQNPYVPISSHSVNSNSQNATGGLSSQPYQQQFSNPQRFDQQNVPSSNVHYYQQSTGTPASFQPLGKQVTASNSASETAQEHKSVPFTHSQHQPHIPYAPFSTASMTYPSTAYSSSGGYVSQAGVNQTNLSPSNQGQNFPASSEVRNTVSYNAPSQYTPAIYAQNTQSTLPSNFMQNIPKSDSYTNLSNPSSVPSPFINNLNSNFNTSTTMKQENMSALYPQTTSVFATNYNPSYSQGGTVSYASSQGISAGNPNAYIQSETNAYNQSISYASTGSSYKSSTDVSSAYQQNYLPSAITSVNSTPYQMPVSSSSVPYSTVQTAISSNSVSHGYSQSYGYGGLPSTVKTNFSTQFQTPHYSNIPTTVPANYALQQVPQQPPHSSQSIQPSHAANSVPSNAKTNQEGISNLDLLSGIDMNVSSSAQWSPLIPQTASPHSSTTNTDSASTSASTVPDITSTLASTTSEKDISDQNGDASVAVNTSSVPATEDVSTALSSTMLDLTKLAKPKRSLSVLDPLSNDETLNLLASETERFSKFVQGLDKKSLNGPTNLELKWNELTDALESKCTNLKVSVGRCYPLKNRFPDNLSFDATRVPLPSTRDDYINASFVQLKSVEDSIPLIVTQAPMPNTFIDFWTMVWENQVEIVVCMNSDAEVKGQIYFPRDAAENLEYGSFTITLKQIRHAANESWLQRTLQLTHNSLKSTKVVMHIQFLTWPPSAMPESPSLFLQFIGEVHNLQKQQRNKLNSVVIHCVSGTGRSGVFAVLSSFIKHLQWSGTLADVWNLILELSQLRRTALQDRSHLLFLYSSALYYAQEVLMKRGILTDKATFEEGPREKTHVRHPSADLLSSDLTRMKAKLGFDEGQSGEDNLSRSGSQSSVVSAESSTGPACQLTSSQQSSVTPSPTHSAKGAKLGATELPPNLAASLDPNCLVLTTPNPNKPKKITKENFLNPIGLGSLSQVDEQNVDPLSGLDPLWSLKKS